MILLTIYGIFLRLYPISNAWPYWREFVQSMSTRMGFPALTVPLLEIVPKKPEEKPKDDVDKKRPRGARRSVRDPLFPRKLYNGRINHAAIFYLVSFTPKDQQLCHA